MKRKSLRVLISFLTLFIFSALLISCGSRDEGQSDELSGAPVKVVSPSSSNMVDYLQLNASTVFLKKEIVRAPFQGYIQKTFKNIGEAVKEGDILFTVQTKESHALNRADQSPENGSVIIKAKSVGVLAQLNFQAGDYVSEGDQIAVISNPESIVVMLNVPYQKASEVKIGSNCALILPDGKKITGNISRTIPSVDVNSQTQAYIIECGSLARLPENLNLTVKIPVKTIPSAIVLPKSCVMSDETLKNFWIMKLISDKEAVKIEVTKGIENDSLVQILEPKLGGTDKIISEGAYGLPDTAKVNIER